MSNPTFRLANFLENVLSPLDDRTTVARMPGGDEAVSRLRAEAQEWTRLGLLNGYFERNAAPTDRPSTQGDDIDGFGSALDAAWTDLTDSQITSLGLVHFASQDGWSEISHRLRNNLRAGQLESIQQDLGWLFASHDGVAGLPSAWRVTYAPRARERMREIDQLRREASLAPISDRTVGSEQSLVELNWTEESLAPVARIEDYRPLTPGDEMAPLEGAAGQAQADWFAEVFARLVGALGGAMPGRSVEAATLFRALFAEQHILVDEEPGSNASELVRNLASITSAHLMSISAGGVQPSDITGVTIYDSVEGRFEFHRGPIFGNLVLISGLAVASLPTRAAVFETMEERKVVVDGVEHVVPPAHCVIAMLNRSVGPLSADESDHFGVSIRVGSADRESMVDLLRGMLESRPLSPPHITTKAIAEIQQITRTVSLGGDALRLILDLVDATNHSPEIDRGVGIRGSLSLARFSQVIALADARTSVSANDVLSGVMPTLEHRLVLSQAAVEAGRTTSQVLGSVIQRVLSSSASTQEKSARKEGS